MSQQLQQYGLTGSVGDQPLLSPRAMRNINRRSREGTTRGVYQTETEELLAMQEELENNKRLIRENMDLITENMANTMSRAYLANPHMNPEIIVSAVFAGADENTIYQMGAQVAEFQASEQIYQDDKMAELEALYPYLADYRNDVRQRASAFDPAKSPRATPEWFNAMTTSRWDEFLRMDLKRDSDGELRVESKRDPKSLGPMGRKITQAEFDQRNTQQDAGIDAARRLLEFGRRWSTGRQPDAPPIQQQARIARDMGEVSQLAPVMPQIAMISAVDVVDYGLTPVRFILDKVTPDFISDPVSDVVRGTTRYGFGAIQGGVDLLENIVMSATANPELAPKSFQALVRQRGVVDGIGAGLREAALSTGFGQTVFRGEQTGSGFFISGDAQREADKLKMFTVGTYLDDNGDYLRMRSLGTMAAEFLVNTNVISQDEFAYNLISGGIDGAFELFADASNYIPFVGWGDEAVAGLKALNSKTASRVADHLAEARRMDDAAKAATNPQTAAWLRTMSDQEARLALEAQGINTSRMNRADVRARMTGTSDQQVAIRSLLLDEAGVIRDGDRRSVILPEFARFLTQGRGRRLVKKVQEETSPTRLQELFRGGLGTNTAVDLAKADTAEDVVAILMRGISDPSRELNQIVKMAPHVGIFSLAEKGLYIRRAAAPYTRMGTLLPPGSVVNPLDPDSSMTTLKQLLSLIPTETGALKLKRYDVAKRNEILDGFMEAFASGNMGEVKKSFGKLAETLEDIFTQLGFDPVTSRALTRYVKDQSRLGEFRWTEIGSDAPIDTLPLMFNDLMSSSIEIIDGRRLQDVIRSTGRISSTLRKLHNSSPAMRELEQLRLQWLELRAAGKNDEAEKLISKMEKQQREIMGKSSDDPTALLDKGFLAWTQYVTDQVNDAWKTFAIARFAYVLRVVPEEAGRVWFSGVFENWVDWLATSLSSFERMSTAGKGRYLSDAAGRRFTRKTRQLQEMEVKHANLNDQLREISDPSSPFYIADANARQAKINAIRNEMDELQVRYEKENEAWDANLSSYGQAQLGDDRTRATRTITRRRARQQYALEATGKASRMNPSQSTMWVDGVTERIIKFNNDPGGAQDFARAHLGYDVGKDFSFDIGGFRGTVKQHLDRGVVPFEEVMAHHYVFGGGAAKYRKHLEALSADGVVRDPTSIDDAMEWVSEVVKEMEYIVGRNPNSIMLQGFQSGAFDWADDKLMEAIATGRFNGMPLQKTDNAKLGAQTGAYNRNRDLQKHIELWAFNDNAPNLVNYTIRRTATFGRKDAMGGTEVFANAIFGMAYGISSDILARSPAFRRLYWKQMAEFVRTASPDQADIILANARKANVSPQLMRKLEINARMSTGNTTWDELDEIVRISALNYTKDLLFDATRRGATSDAMRIMVAFGDAWYEVLKTWTRVNLQRGGMPIKSLMKGIDGSQDFSIFGEHVPFTTWEMNPETGELEEKTSQKRKGFVYKDQTDDQYYFGLPMSSQIARLAAGFAIGGETGPLGELRAPVEGLNIFGTLSPGLGPIGQIAVEPLIPPTPNADWLWDLLAPYGRQADPQTQAAADAGLGALTPLWFRRILGAGAEYVPPLRSVVNLLTNYQRDPAYVNLQLNIMKALDSTGNYAWDRQGRRQLQSDTQKAARNSLALLALGHFIGPAAPQMRHLLATRNPETGEIEGDIVAHQFAQELNERRRLYVELGENPNQAVNDMVFFYGPELELSTVPNTNSKFPGQELSQQWWDWYRTGTSKEFLGLYPDIGAFFGAVNAERENDVAFQMRAEGLTTPKSLDELNDDAKRARGFRRYNTWLQNNGLDGPEANRTPEQSAAAQRVRREIERDLGVVLDSRESQERRRQQLNELSDMIRIYNSDDPKDAAARAIVAPQMESDMGQLVRIYMTYRSAMQQAGMNIIGLQTEDSWLQSWQAAPLRDNLRKIGVALSERNEGFARLYQFVLVNEMLSEERERPPVIRESVQGGVR